MADFKFRRGEGALSRVEAEVGIDQALASKSADLLLLGQRSPRGSVAESIAPLAPITVVASFKVGQQPTLRHELWFRFRSGRVEEESCAVEVADEILAARAAGGGPEGVDDEHPLLRLLTFNGQGKEIGTLPDLFAGTGG